MSQQCVNCPGAEDHSTAQCPLVSAQKNELRQIITDALVSMVSGVTGLVPPTGPGQIPDFIQAPIDRAVEKISASLPVGVPDDWRRAVYQAEECLTGCLAAPEVARALDADTVRKIVANLQAARFAMLSAPTVKAEQPDMADAYVGAREDLAILKRRALEAEQKARRQEQIIDHLTLEAQGETRFGEPSMPSAQPVAVIEYAGYDPANSIKWLNKGLQYMEPGTLLYAQAPSMPAAGSAVEEVEVVAYLHERSGAVATADNVRVMEEGSVSSGYTIRLMNEAQCLRMLEQQRAALSAQQSAPDAPERVSVPVEATASSAQLREALLKVRGGAINARECIGGIRHGQNVTAPELWGACEHLDAAITCASAAIKGDV